MFQEYIISQQQEMDSPQATPTRPHVTTANHVADVTSENEAASAVNKTESTNEARPKNTTPRKAASPAKGTDQLVSKKKMKKR